MTDLALRPLTEVADRVSRRELPPSELTRAVLGRVDTEERRLNAFVTVFRDQLLEQAEAADVAWRAGRALPPLHGVPVAVKDNVAVRGHPTTNGSVLAVAHRPSQDAAVVDRLRSAGALIVGKNTMHEWAMGGTSVGLHGEVRNPWDVTRVPGGSSGGSAVAVAVGMAYAAIGTDGMGSVRSPASFCGVVGYKASAGRISRYGVLPPTTSPFDQIGILTRRATDLPTLLRILEGHDPRDPTSAPPAPSDPAGLTSTRLRVGLVTGDLLQDVVPDVDAALGDVAGLLTDLGHTVLPLELPELDDLPLAMLGAQFENQTYLLEAALAGPDSFVDPDVRLRVLAAELVTDADARRARQLRARLRARLMARFTEVDLLLLPSTPVPAFDAHGGQVLVGPASRPLLLDTPGAAKRLTTRLTVPWNVLGAPALSMPARRTAGGLPVGVQLVAAPGRDGMLLRAAAALEEAVGPYVAPPRAPVRPSGP